MGIYRNACGREIVVCDGCGIAFDGTKPDPSELTPVDVAASLGLNLPDGVTASVKDWCPDCCGSVTEDDLLKSEVR